MIDTEYMKAVDILETLIDISMTEYYQTGDVDQLFRAHKYNLELEEERRVHYVNREDDR